MRVIILLLATGLCLLSACQSTPPTDDIQSSDTLVIHDSSSPQVETANDAEPTPSVETVIYQDLWHRLTVQLTLNAQDQALVEHYKKWYLQRPKHVERITQNAAPFLYHVVEALEQHQLPLEIALIPLLESAYNPAAYNRGIAGMWQFTSATAKNYQLPINDWYDGRKDPIASTQAVVRMMTHLHQYLGQDWLNALAAYNAGEGRVLREIKANEEKGLSTDFWDLNLPKVTKHYVPKLLALADVIKNASTYGIKLAPIANAPSTVVVDAGSQIDLSTAATLANIPTKKLRQLNPGYLQWMTAPKGPHTLLIPASSETQFTQQLAKTDLSSQKSTDRYKIQSGDSLALIAKRFHTSTEALRSLNHLKNDTIIAGKYLLIPTNNAMAATIPQVPTSAATHTTSAQPERNTQHYKVKSGDSIWKVAKKFNVTSKQLAQWNHLDPKAGLTINQILVINPTP